MPPDECANCEALREQIAELLHTVLDGEESEAADAYRAQFGNPRRVSMPADLTAALGEIMRMRRAAEGIIWLAEESPRYGKGRGQAAQEILGAAADRVPVLAEADAREVLQELRERQQVRDQEQPREDERRGRR